MMAFCVHLIELHQIFTFTITELQQNNGVCLLQMAVFLPTQLICMYILLCIYFLQVFPKVFSCANRVLREQDIHTSCFPHTHYEEVLVLSHRSSEFRLYMHHVCTVRRFYHFGHDQSAIENLVPVYPSGPSFSKDCRKYFPRISN